jgi:hypothetical protein
MDDEIKHIILFIVKLVKLFSLKLLTKYGTMDDNSPTIIVLRNTSLHTLRIFNATIFLRIINRATMQIAAIIIATIVTISGMLPILRQIYAMGKFSICNPPTIN